MPQTLTLERVYVWELPVRLTHWLIFFSIIVLSATGYYIGNPFISVPGAARDHFVMGTVRAVHFYAAIVFALAVLVRIYWLFAGNNYARLTQFIPLSRRAPAQSSGRRFCFIPSSGTIRTTTQVIMRLAGASYAMIFGIYLVMIATGLALYTVDVSAGSPFKVFNFLIPLFGGLQIARLIHHIGMWIGAGIRRCPHLLCVLVVGYRTHRNIRFDLFRLQVHARAKSGILVSNEIAAKSADKTIDVLVLGLGNVLLGDDGLGAAAVACVERDYSHPLGRPTRRRRHAWSCAFRFADGIRTT